jgi:hypothetical protein
VGQELIPVEAEVVEGFLEQPADPARGVVLERNVSLAAALGDRLKVLQAGVCLVGRHFRNLEVLVRFLDQRDELRAVGGVLTE